MKPSPPSPQRTIENEEQLREVLALAEPVKTLLSLDKSCVQGVVELLESETNAISTSNDQYRRLCMKCLRALVKKYQILPSSIFLSNIECHGDYPVGGGGFSDIWKGSAGKQDVCLKVIRLHIEGDQQKRHKIYSTFCQEALLWTHLKHQNVLPFLGVNTELFPSRFCLISPWMKNGDIISFLRRFPNHDRLKSFVEIAAGLQYLHSLGIVHGDIKGVNILVDNNLQCCLADFGLAAAATESQNITSASGAIKGSLRWLAPEVYMSVQNGPEKDKCPRDVYAFACTIYEIMTGQPPFHDLLEAALIYHVLMLKARPERPTDVWCPDNVWNLVERCWAEDPQQRPRTEQVHAFLKELMSLRNVGNNAESGIVLVEQVAKTRDTLDYPVADEVDTTPTPSPILLHRSPELSPVIRNMSVQDGQSHHQPLELRQRARNQQNQTVPPNHSKRDILSGSQIPSLSRPMAPKIITTLDDHPYSSSDSATFELSRGELIREDQLGKTYIVTTTDGDTMAMITAEVPRTDASHDQQTAAQMMRNQRVLLRRLSHPNVIQCFGLVETPPTLNLFLEHLPGGSIAEALEKFGKLSDENTRYFTSQIASGLEYLHSEGILHRGLKAENILMNHEGVVKISGFSTPFWTSPEAAYNRGRGYDYKLDIWALGCVVLEMLSGTRPWAGLGESDVVLKLLSEKYTPPLPPDVVLSELAGDFMKWCLTINPHARPTAAMVRTHEYLALPLGWKYGGIS
ncbi:hypothetical protein Moror_1274 [Moniliophthora roreri MCA 2997]|uniref:Protein kinase domain-containing protein n=1 Tax=Moniliophthora roreri (strain MCA 2997) TaxID=1381753 RepID=V2X6Q9_MONRO|nr:hypothetical protein Moror_1274 [Moniliophthora roreri MCA 2997]